MSKISELSDGGSLVSSDYLIAVRSGGNVKVRMDSINVDQVDLGDNEFIRLGNSQDLTMVHTSTQSIINQAGIGDLLLQKAGATKLTINASGIDVTGSVTADAATIQTASNEEDALLIKQSDGTDVGALRINNGSFILKGKSASQPVQIQSHDGNEDIEIDPDGFIKFETAGSERLRIDADGATIYNGKELRVKRPNGSGDIRLFNTASYATLESTVDPIYIKSANAIRFDTGGNNQRMLLDASGNLLVGKTATGLGNQGAELSATGQFKGTASNQVVAYLNRTSADGTIAEFRKDNTVVGSIGTTGGKLYIGSQDGSDAFLRFESNEISPCAHNGDFRDDIINLGKSASRFKDLYLSGTANIGSIQQTVSSTALAASIENTNTAGYGMRITTYATGAEYAFAVDSYGGGYSRDFTIGADGNVNVLTGNLTVAGSISKGSGSFKIDHPLPEKSDTHHLVHSFVESPQADNIYRGKVDLVDGSATVNIDDAAGMTEGTYVLLNTNTQCFTSNESGWTAVRGSVSDNILTITAQDSCSDTISWMVVGERHDQHMLDTEWTDENGKVIVEPLKESQGDAP